MKEEFQNVRHLLQNFFNNKTNGIEDRKLHNFQDSWLLLRIFFATISSVFCRIHFHLPNFTFWHNYLNQKRTSFHHIYWCSNRWQSMIWNFAIPWIFSLNFTRNFICFLWIQKSLPLFSLSSVMSMMGVGFGPSLSYQ